MKRDDRHLEIILRAVISKYLVIALIVDLHITAERSLSIAVLTAWIGYLCWIRR